MRTPGKSSTTCKRKASIDDAAATDRAAKKTVEMFADMRKAGVKMLAGSDLPVATGVPPIHDERNADNVRVATSVGHPEHSSNVQRFKHLRSDRGGHVHVGSPP
jgi:predicted amidohydrolase YtcJ